MRNMSIGRQIALLVGTIAAAFILAASVLISGLIERVYQERYSTLRTAVEAAVSLMAAYESRVEAGDMPRDEAQARALEAITKMRYDPDGYFFTVDRQSIMRQHINPAVIGKDYSQVQDETGQFFINEIVKAGRAGGGVTVYPWAKPGAMDGPAYPKASYSLEFAPWGLTVGTGVYIDDLDAEVQGVILQGLAELAVVLGLAAAAAFWLLRGFVGPLGAIKAALVAVADEDTSAQVPGLDMKNEIGSMARATVALQRKVAERHAMLADQERQRVEMDALRDEAAQRQREEAERQSAVMGRVAETLERIADGDLTVRCERFEAPYTPLSDNLNDALTRLEDAMLKVRGKGEDLRGAKDDILQSSRTLSQRTEMQAATLEETAAAVEELSAGVRKTADGAAEAAKLVRGVADEAKQNMSSAIEAVEAMRAIDEAAQQIKAIVGVIDDIAFQTNLLALNASVEAARVGEAGKGFAVVAQEVRELASRSGGAAKQISEQIREAAARIEAGVRLVGAAGDSFEIIVSRIGHTTEVVDEIAVGAGEQDGALRSIAASINELDGATQQNAALAEEGAASAQALGGDIDSLGALLDGFRVGGAASRRRRAA